VWSFRQAWAQEKDKLKAAVRQVMRHLLSANRFVFGTDVKSYYASIDHFLLPDPLAEHIKDRRALNPLGQYLRRTAERGGVFRDYVRGISLGCPRARSWARSF